MKGKTDKVINAVAILAIIAFFIGAMAGIWVGMVGVKILLSAVVMFVGDSVMHFWLRQREKEQEQREKERKRRRSA